MSLFQGVGIKESHCIHGGVLISRGWNRGVPLYTEVSSFKCVRIVPLYTEVSSFQGVGTEEFHSTQWCPHVRVLE